ncbi:hypothetical protein RND71_025214 [Anisodus tanguticus]|uniref:Uncharacterized protein n=1 Tax=Anisodus tanguticus TaxID=243964 RepID=A0AAE1V4M6_9SOLA|nr:hypothetical protein RND71_025214 [Anisodus tanguticus]
MSISLEALAMVGADYLKNGMSLEEFEKYEAQVPPYLLADEDDDEIFFSRKMNISIKDSYEYSFCSQEIHRCENDEGEHKKPLLRNFSEFLKKE